MLDITLQDLINQIEYIQEARLLNQQGGILAWHCTLKYQNCISSGFHPVKKISRQIAFSELLERIAFNDLCKKNYQNKFNLSQYPSTDGFAGGFHKKRTRTRAIAEGLERWAWEQWIDHSCDLSMIEFPTTLYSDITKEVLLYFDKSYHFFKKFELEEEGCFYFMVTLCDLDDGVFVGSKVGQTLPDLLNHSVLECFRNLRIYQESEMFESHSILERINYFATQKKHAHNIVFNKKRDQTWTKPKIRLLDNIVIDDGFYLYRCLFEDFIGWEKGGEGRFII